MTSVTLLEARDVTVWRGDVCLFESLNFAVKRGELWQIEGANGSGKTTLLRVLAGLSYLDDGDVYWRGEPLHMARDEMLAETLFISHKPGISGRLTPLENLEFQCALRGASRQQIQTALTQLKLGDRLHVPCAALSAGQQRRVSLARLTLESAALWILDEPLTALDVEGRHWVEAALRARLAAGGAVILTTHQPLSMDGISCHSLRLREAFVGGASE